MPRANYENLRYLLAFLHQVTRRADENRMSAHNLAICIGPNLLWPPTHSVLTMQHGAASGHASGVNASQAGVPSFGSGSVGSVGSGSIGSGSGSFGSSRTATAGATAGAIGATVPDGHELRPGSVAAVEQGMGAHAVANSLTETLISLFERLFPPRTLLPYFHILTSPARDYNADSPKFNYSRLSL